MEQTTSRSTYLILAARLIMMAGHKYVFRDPRAWVQLRFEPTLHKLYTEITHVRRTPRDIPRCTQDQVSSTIKVIWDYKQRIIFDHYKDRRLDRDYSLNCSYELGYLFGEIQRWLQGLSPEEHVSLQLELIKYYETYSHPLRKLLKSK